MDKDPFTERVTPESIRATWRHLVATHDEVLGTPNYAIFLRTQFNSEASFAGPLAALRARERADPMFFAQHPYGWAFNSESYDFSVECAYQVRILDAAIGMWKALDQTPQAHLCGIVARQTLSSGLLRATPSVRHESGLTFVICPIGWNEFLAWIFAAFTADCGLARADEPGSTTDIEPSRGDEWRKMRIGPIGTARSIARSHWLHLLAAMIASEKCESEVLIPQAIGAILKEVPAFFDGIADLSLCHESVISRDMSYLAAEMALSHEVGHVLRGDHLPNTRADETLADLLAHEAFRSSWGWRSFCLRESGLSDVGGWLFGAQAFMWGMNAWGLIGAELVDAAPSLRARWRRALADDMTKRGAAAARRLDEYLRRSPQQPTPDDVRVMDLVYSKFALHIAELIRFIRAFDTSALEAAADIAALQRVT